MTDERLRFSPSAEWSDMNRDLSVAIGVFAVCVLMLAVAFNEPDKSPIDTDGEHVAMNHVGIPTADDVDDATPDVNDDFSFDDSDGDDSETFIPDTDSPDDSDLSGIDDAMGDTSEDVGIATTDDDSSDGTSEFDFSVPEDDTDDDDMTEVIVVSDSGDSTDDIVVTDADDESTGRPLSAGEDQLHTVARGEVLGTISQQYYGTTRYWKMIQDANNVYPHELQVGQRLIIPGLPDDERVVARSTGSRVADVSLEDGQRSYTVKRGDNYYVIAQRELGDASRFKELERLNGIDPYELDVGDVIVLPEGRSVRTTTSPEPRVISGADVHVVQTGETLGDISKQHYGTTTRWREIAAANGNVDPARLRVGQKLQIPPDSGSSRSGATPVSSTPTASGSGRSYTIKSGDTLGEISQRELGTATRWREIQALNPGLNPVRLTVGKTIKLPGSGSGASRVTDPEPSTDISIDFSD